jgi:hypothetical protein
LDRRPDGAREAPHVPHPSDLGSDFAPHVLDRVELPLVLGARQFHSLIDGDDLRAGMCRGPPFAGSRIFEK